MARVERAKSCGACDSSKQQAHTEAVHGGELRRAQRVAIGERVVWSRERFVHRRIRAEKGRLEIADECTVFLDEAGELTPPLQVKLLRASGEFERVGGTVTINVDLRLIAATNKNLEDAIEMGQFRQDLYYRLNVVSLEMPALRERREDIMLLANYFADKFGARGNRKLKGFSTEARNYLTAYDWPGNVRELENTIERAVVLGTTEHNGGRFAGAFA